MHIFLAFVRTERRFPITTWPNEFSFGSNSAMQRPHWAGRMLLAWSWVNGITWMTTHGVRHDCRLLCDSHCTFRVWSLGTLSWVSHVRNRGKFFCLPVSGWVSKYMWHRWWDARILRICWQWRVGHWVIPFDLVAMYFLLTCTSPNGFGTMLDVFYFPSVRLVKCGWSTQRAFRTRRPCGLLVSCLCTNNCWNSDTSLWGVNRKQGDLRQHQQQRKSCN